MKKVEWKTQVLTLAAGETRADKDLHLEKGERIVVAAVPATEPGKIVNLGLYEGGNEISSPMDIAFWERSNAGQYLDGFKPISFKGGTTVTTRLTTATALVADLQVQVVFGIIKEEVSC